MKKTKRRPSMSDRMYDALREAELARESVCEVEERIDKARYAVAVAYRYSFGAPPPDSMDVVECANKVRDWVRTVQSRPAASASVEATAVAIIENIALAAGIDMIAVRMANPSEVQALIYVRSLLAFPSLCEKMDMVKRKPRPKP